MPYLKETGRKGHKVVMKYNILVINNGVFGMQDLISKSEEVGNSKEEKRTSTTVEQSDCSKQK